MKQRMQVDPTDMNWQKFRLAMTLQDMAMLKLEMRKYDDAMLHLRETEDTLRQVTPESSSSGRVTNLIYELANERNEKLF